MNLVTIVLSALLLHASSSEMLGAKPYLGWSSWSLSAIKDRPPYGRDWLTAARVLEQSEAMNRTLQASGYEYINIDSLWASDPTKTVDEFGRWTSDPVRFPSPGQTFADVARTVHARAQKIGIYLNPGIARAAVAQNTPIEGTQCRAADIAFRPLQNGNVFGDCYRVNFSHPCAQAYFDSFARLLARWQVDLLKLDAVSPGSGSATIDNRADVAAWGKALRASGRDIWLVVSWCALLGKHRHCFCLLNWRVRSQAC